MKAMLLDRCVSFDPSSGTWSDTPLRLADVPLPIPSSEQVRVRTEICGVCHTELDELEGRLPPPHLPAILGHQIVGTVDALGVRAGSLQLGDRVGIAWIHSACGACAYCAGDRENLCPEFAATGLDAPGGYAEYVTAPASFTYPIPPGLESATTAPLLCAGAIGYRSLRLAEVANLDRLGLIGFGASAHLVLQLMRQHFPKIEVFVFARDADQRSFALELGAAWVGTLDETPATLLDAVIDTTPAWGPVLRGLERIKPGGRMIVNAIRKESTDREQLLELDYARHLWKEKQLISVANVTRADVRAFLELAAQCGLGAHVEEFALEDANLALASLRRSGSKGATVLRVLSD